MRILLIVNQHARRGLDPIEDALTVLARAGHSVHVETMRRGDASAATIRNHVGAADAIVLAGGDGTIRDAGPALLEARLPVGILPCGTANDLARALGIPTDLTAAAEIIVAGATRPVDVGEAGNQPFFNVAHVGLGAALASALTPAMKRRFGPFAYALAAARALSGVRPFRVELIAPDERLAIRTYALTIGNGPYFGGGAVVAEEASISDGLLHVFALTTNNPFRLAMLLPSIMRGRQTNSGVVRTLVASQIEVRTIRPMKIRADGDTVGTTPATFRVLPAALQFFAPPATGP